MITLTLTTGLHKDVKLHFTNPSRFSILTTLANTLQLNFKGFQCYTSLYPFSSRFNLNKKQN